MSAAIKLARAKYQGDAGYARAMPGIGYQGDPGLFGSIIGGIKSGFSVASRFMPGGGAIRGAIGLAQGAISRLRGGGARPSARNIGTIRGRQEQLQILPMGGRMRGPRAVEPVPGLKGLAQRIIPGGETGLQVPGVAIGARVPQGYHLNKSAYWTGAGGMNPVYIPKESIFVKNRKRNPLNPRAWDRAFGRLNSAQNFKKKMGRITIREKC